MRDFSLEVYFSKWEFTARHHMTASDMQSMSTADLLAMASPEDRESFQNCWLGYSETPGAVDLRETIAATYDTLRVEHIACFAGAEEAIYAAMRVLLEPSDHAIVAVPNYQAAETLPLSICAVTGVPLREAKGGWCLDPVEIEAAIRPNTKLLSVNFPNNPTGCIPSPEDFQAMIEICREHDLYLFSDEVYRLLELDDTKRLPQAADVYEKALSLNVMSKAYGLPGLRIGWLASQDTGALERILRYKNYLSICNSAPGERLALIALRARDQILERNRKLVRENLEKLDTFFDDYADLFAWTRPDGGCVAYPKYTGGGGVEEFCARLLKDVGVLLLPASIYSSELIDTPADRFRIGCGRAGMDEGLAAFRDFLNRNHNELAR